MNLQPKISLLIPVYNVENTLDACLNSAENQSLNEIEIICVDDGSTDHSFDILQKHAARASRLILLRNNHNSGRFSARKTAVEKAAGQYIMFLDSDDTLVHHACAEAFRQIQTHNVDIFHFGSEILFAKDVSRKIRTEVRQSFKICNGFLKGDAIFSACFGNMYRNDFYIWNKIYSAELCKKAYSLLDELVLTVSEDLYFYFAAALLARSYYGTDIPLYKYYFQRGICSGTFQKISREQFEQFCATSQISEHLQGLLKKQNALNDVTSQILHRIHRKLFDVCYKKIQCMDYPQEWQQLFVQNWLHNDLTLFEFLRHDRNLLREYEQSLSVQLGLFLTWLPRKLLSLLTGRKY